MILTGGKDFISSRLPFILYAALQVISVFNKFSVRLVPVKFVNLEVRLLLYIIDNAPQLHVSAQNIIINAYV